MESKGSVEIKVLLDANLLTLLCYIKNDYHEIYKCFRTIIILQYYSSYNWSIIKRLCYNNNVNIIKIGVKFNIILYGIQNMLSICGPMFHKIDKPFPF